MDIVKDFNVRHMHSLHMHSQVLPSNGANSL
jgi:hypothetical protein